jgi:alkylation response protein AidB-like acyl-CoA dehydrogenase
MAFFQDPPRLGNTFDDDALLKEYLSRTLTDDARRELEPELRHLGEQAGGPLYRLQLEDRLREPVLTQWDPWGHRIDHIEVTPLWKEAQKLAARHGLVATGYEAAFGDRARVAQFAKLHVLDPSWDVYSCPLAMTDGAARTLLDHGNQPLIARALPHLTSRDPDQMWTSGQWMTERTGGSDVGLSETVAKKDGDQWKLYGTKWFTSAVTSQMTLTLARPEGNGSGGRGLALFYVELRDAQGRLNHITVNRLKDKLGTRKVPTAELALDGTTATPVAGLADGVRNIASMLNITRTWNAVCAAAGMQRCLQLAHDYSRRRVAFGAPLANKPLHADTLAAIEAEAQGAFLLAFRAVELIGRKEHGTITEEEQRLLRALTPIVKLTTGRQGVAVASETLEAFGGAGYVEDTGLPRLLRDAQVLPIWEGTTNVLSLDTLRALSSDGAVQALQAEIARHLAAVRSAELAACVATAKRATEHAGSWLSSHLNDAPALEAGARRFALTLGRTLELALSAAHADWCLQNGRGDRAARIARRLAQEGIDRIFE